MRVAETLISHNMKLGGIYFEKEDFVRLRRIKTCVRVVLGFLLDGDPDSEVVIGLLV